MEQSSYWMWTRREYSKRPLMGAQISTLAAVGGSYDKSWEELAFAKDAAGHLGGCIWPPRSYSCSFCRREFRSAQALGGHMNVHRRDRARLRQSSSSPIAENVEDHYQQYPNPCVDMYGTSANPNPSFALLVSPTSTTPRFSALSTQGIKRPSDHTMLSTSLSSSIIQEKMEESVLSPTRSLKYSIPLQLFMVPESKLIGKDDLVLKEAGSPVCRDLGEDIGGVINCSKRRRTETMPAFYMKSCSGEQFQSEVLNPNDAEGLDLELRLGCP